MGGEIRVGRGKILVVRFQIFGPIDDLPPLGDLRHVFHVRQVQPFIGRRNDHGAQRLVRHLGERGDDTERGQRKESHLRSLLEQPDAFEDHQQDRPYEDEFLAAGILRLID
ncbi:hypothetical protein D3C87_1718610 [compost metagenome]